MICQTVLKKTNTVSFADDTSFSCKGSDSFQIEEKLNSDCENVHKWLLSNKLTSNKEKTAYMITGSR